MRELRRWLHWATNETQVPARERALKAEWWEGHSAPPWVVAVDAACTLIADRALPGEGQFPDQPSLIAWCLTHHPDAFRDLCLAFADAIERMRERVSEGKPATEPSPQTLDGWREWVTVRAAESLAVRPDADGILVAGRRYGRTHDLRELFVSGHVDFRREYLGQQQAFAPRNFCVRGEGGLGDRRHCLGCMRQPCRWSDGSWPRKGAGT